MKKKLCVLTLAASVVLTGCTEVPDLSNVDNNLAAQYVADALLKNDKEYDAALDYDHSLLQATPTPVPTAVPTPVPSDSEAGTSDNNPGGATANPDGNETGDDVISVSLSGIYGMSGVKIKAGSYRVMSSYGSDYAVCMAGSGKKLVVVNFTVSNATKKAKRVNLADKGMQAELLSGTKVLGRPLLSIVEGDLQYFNTMIAAGENKQGVLIFEVGKSTRIKDVKVRFSKGNKESVVAVQ